MVSELAFGTDISVESDALDAEFLAEIGRSLNERVPRPSAQASLYDFS